MSLNPIHSSTASRPDPVPRLLSAAALCVSVAALIFSMGGFAPAAGHGAHHQTGKSSKSARSNAKALAALKTGCPVTDAVRLGTWCLESTPHTIPAGEIGQNDFFYAAQTCVKEGGWLPSAAQLIGAAPEVALDSTIDDSPATADVTEFPNATEGIKDKREMSSDLATTESGGRAAGSEGVTAGSKGVGSAGEPDPVPTAAEPVPEDLDYITVYDNHDQGGFAGGEQVGRAENFRCAYAADFQGRPRHPKEG